jgi:hypothetical protein
MPELYPAPLTSDGGLVQGGRSAALAGRGGWPVTREMAISAIGRKPTIGLTD